jgi:hypothetical protein
MELSNKVDVYIDKQKSPQKEICRKLRDIILKTFPGINEEMKLGVPWYQDKFYIVSLKNYVNLGFSLQGLSSKETSLFKGSGKTMKHITIRSLEEIEENRIVELLRVVKT